jgi:hypothetical protein
VHGSQQPLTITNVAYEESQVRSLKAGLAHFVLFELVPAENDDLLGMEITLQDLNEPPPE